MTPNTADDVVKLLLALQGLWGIFLIVITWAMKRVLKDIEENTTATQRLTDSVSGINTLLAGNFVTKPELLRMEERMRWAEQKITELNSRDEYRDKIVDRIIDRMEQR